MFKKKTPKNQSGGLTLSLLPTPDLTLLSSGESVPVPPTAAVNKRSALSRPRVKVPEQDVV